jgi:hypothetical protein
MEEYDRDTGIFQGHPIDLGTRSSMWIEILDPRH